MADELDPLLIEQQPRPTGQIIQQAEIQESPDYAPLPVEAAAAPSVDAFARGVSRPNARAEAARAVAEQPALYNAAPVPEQDIWHRRYVDPVLEQRAQAEGQRQASSIQRQQQTEEDKRAKQVLKGLKDAGVDLDVDPVTGQQVAKRDAQGRLLYKPAIISPLEQRGDSFVTVKRDRFGNDVDVPIQPKIDPQTGERYVVGEDGVTRQSLGVDQKFLNRKSVTEAGQVASYHRQALAAHKAEKKALEDQQKALATEAASLGINETPTEAQRIRLAAIAADQKRISQQLANMGGKTQELTTAFTAANDNFLTAKQRALGLNTQEVADGSPGAALSLAAGKPPVSVSVPDSGQPAGITEFMSTPAFKGMTVDDRVKALKGWVEQQVEWRKANEPGFDEKAFRGQFPDRGGFWGGVKDFFSGLWSGVVDGIPEMGARAWRNGDISLNGGSWVDRFIDEQRADAQAKGQSLQSVAEGKTSDWFSGPANVAPSLGTSVAGFAAGGPVGAGVAPLVAFYRSSKDQFLEDVRDTLVSKGAKLSEEQWNKAKSSLEGDAIEFGAAEAIPEALSSMFSAWLFKGTGKIIASALGREGAEQVVKQSVAKTLAKFGGKIAGEVGEELTTETATQAWQGAIEARPNVGIREKAPTIREAFDEIKGPTIIASVLQGGGQAAYHKIRNAREIAKVGHTPDAAGAKPTNEDFAQEWNDAVRSAQPGAEGAQADLRTTEEAPQITPQDSQAVQAIQSAAWSDEDIAELDAAEEDIQRLVVERVAAEQSGDAARLAEIDANLATVEERHDEISRRAESRQKEVVAAVQEVVDAKTPKEKAALGAIVNLETGAKLTGAQQQAIMGTKTPEGAPVAKAVPTTEGKKIILTPEGKAHVQKIAPAVAKIAKAKPIRAKKPAAPAAQPAPTNESRPIPDVQSETRPSIPQGQEVQAGDEGARSPDVAKPVQQETGGRVAEPQPQSQQPSAPAVSPEQQPSVEPKGEAPGTVTTETPPAPAAGSPVMSLAHAKTNEEVDAYRRQREKVIKSSGLNAQDKGILLRGLGEDSSARKRALAKEAAAPAQTETPPDVLTQQALSKPETRRTLADLGVDLKIGKDARGMSIRYNPNGKIWLQVDAGAFNQLVENREAGEREAFILSALSHEIIHAAGLIAVRNEWVAGGRKGSFTDAAEAEYSKVAEEMETTKLGNGQTMADFVRQAQGNEKLKGADLAFEGIAQLTQMEREGMPVEGYFRTFLRKVLDVLKSFLSDKKSWSPALQKAYDDTKRVLDNPQQEAKKEETKPAPEFKKEPKIEQPTEAVKPKSTASDKLKAEGKAAFKGLFLPAESDEQVGLPKDRRAQFFALADSMEAEGITTPEAVARFLDDISEGKARKFSQALWDTLSAAGYVPTGVQDWKSVYAALDKDAEQPNNDRGGNADEPTNQPLAERAGSPEAGNAQEAGVQPDARGNLAGGRVGDRGPGSVADVGAGRQPVAAREGSDVATVGRETAVSGGQPRESSPVVAVGDSGTVRGTEQPAPPYQPSNYLLKPGELPTKFSATQRFEANLAAIRTLKTIEAERRQATPQEQAILAQYVGWGGLKNAFTENKEWTAKAAALKELLTEEEYANARRSIQDAHYTSEVVVRDGIYAALRRFGFVGGKVIEGGVGTGNFIGLMPEDMRGPSSYLGVEQDSLTARIAKQLYPQANIVHEGFQRVPLTKDSFDAAIGNPPFGSQRLFDKAHPEASNFSIHNFFIAKQIEALRPNGIGAWVVSRYFLDAQDPTARKWINERAEFLGAIRLPNDAFKGNANTQVTTDLVFFRKRAPGEVVDTNAAWLNAAEITLSGRAGEITDKINGWMVQNRSAMLGRPAFDGKMNFGGDEFTLHPTGNLQEQLAAAVAALPEGVYRDITRDEGHKQVDTALADVPANVKVGSYFVAPDGKLKRRGNDENTVRTAQDVEEEGEATQERIKGMIGIRDTMNRLVRAEVQDRPQAELDAIRKKLNETYDAFVKKHGPLNTLGNRRAFALDTDAARVLGLERDFDPGVSRDAAKKKGIEARKPSAQKADIFRQRVNVGYQEVTTANTAQDALLVSLNQRGSVDLDYMAKLTGKSPESILADLGDQIFKNPAGGLEQAAQYLSGNVRQKLKQAQEMAKTDRSYEKNVKALEKVIPADIEPHDIRIPIGAGWVSPEYVSEFAESLVGKKPSLVAYAPSMSIWNFQLSDGSVASTSTYGTAKVPFDEIMQHLLNSKAIRVYRKVGETSEFDATATAEAEAKADEVRLKWDEWIMKDAGRRETLKRTYNDTFNNYVDPHYSGLHLTLPGKSAAITLRPHQVGAAWRIITDRTALLDHVVGAGKTYAVISSIMEMRRMGIARKPMVVVPNHLTTQWRDEFVRLYPNANVLYATPADFQKKNRQRLFARILTGDYDAVIVGHSSLKKIPLPPEAELQIYREMVDEVAKAIEEMRTAERAASGKGRDSRFLSQMERTKESLEAKMEKAAARVGERDQVATLEELGIDGLFVDEAHEFKNLFYSTQMTRVAGLGDAEGSSKAFDLYAKTRFMRQRFSGKAPIVFATGTPVSNSLVEMFTIQRYLQPEKLKEMGITTLDSWARVFGDVKNVYEVDPSGTGYRLSQRFAGFLNVGELSALYRNVADVITMDDLQQQAEEQGQRFPVPKVAGGKPTNFAVERTKQQADYMGEPRELTKDGEPVLDGHGNPIVEYPKGSILYRIENMPDDPAIDNMLKVTNDARKASLDMRLVNPSLPDDPKTKPNVAVGEIVDIYNAWNDRKGTQLVFCDLSVPASARGQATKRVKEAIETTVFIRKGPNGLSVAENAKPEVIEAAPEHKFYAYKSEGRWFVNEVTSGMALGNGATKAEAVSVANARIRGVSPEKFNEAIEKNKMEPAVVAQVIDEHREANRIRTATPEDSEDSDELAPDTTEEAFSMDSVLADTSKFSVYDDMKAKLIAAGIPEAQIAFIHDYDTPQKKAKLFDQMNRGDVRILFGSTAKMGAGTNVQRKLVALHHLDAPWRPSDLEQREGRIIRQGNEFFTADPEGFRVVINRYATKQTYDTRMWQIIEHKAGGIQSFRRADRSTRQMDDVSGEAANAADMKAAASGDPRIQKEIVLRNQIQKLTTLQRAFNQNKYSLESQYERLKKEPTRIKPLIDHWREWEKIATANPKQPFAATTPKGVKLEEKKEVIEAFKTGIESAKVKPDGQGPFLNYRGVKFGLKVRADYVEITATVGNRLDDTVSTIHADDQVTGASLITRIDNFMDGRPADMISQYEAELARREKDMPQVAEELKKPFRQQEELDVARKEHAQVLAELKASKGVKSLNLPADTSAQEREAEAAGLKYDGEMEIPGGGSLFTDPTTRSTIIVRGEFTPEKFAEKVRQLRERYERKLSLPADDRAEKTSALLRKTLTAALKRLPAQAQQVITLATQGKTFTEIGEQLGINERKARYLYDRGTAELRRARNSISQIARAFDRAMNEESGQRTVGESTAYLANPTTGPKSRVFVDTVRELDRKAGKPVQKDEDVQAEADALLESGEWTPAKLIDRGNAGGQLSPQETLASKALIARATATALRSNNIDKMREAAKLISAYDATGTEQARSFRQRRDELRGPEERAAEFIGRTMFSPTRGEEKALKKARERGKDGKATQDAIHEGIAKRAKKTQEDIRKLGLPSISEMTPAELSAFFRDPVKVQKVIRAIAARRATIADKLHEYWISSILSGIPTNVVNLTGNTLNASWDNSVQRFAEALVNLVVRDPKSAQLGEFKEIARSFGSGAARAARNAVRSMSTEAPTFEEDVLGEAGEISPEQYGKTAIRGKLGRVVRTPLWLLRGTDEASKAFIGQAFAQATAYRMAKAEGLTGQALRDRTQLLSLTEPEAIAKYLPQVKDSDALPYVNDEAKRIARITGEKVSDLEAETNGPAWQSARERAALQDAKDAGWTNEAWIAAAERATELTFQNGDPVLRYLSALRNSSTVLKFILPFVVTPYNIFKQAAKMSPLGTLPLVWKSMRQGFVRLGWDNSGPHYSRTEFVRDSARQLVAWTVLAALYSLVVPDDDELPFITGTTPYSPANKGQRDLANRVAPPQSIRVGDRWYSYARIEPFGTALSFVVDGLNRVKDSKNGKDTSGVLGDAFQSVTAQLVDKTFLRGVGDILKAIQDGGSVADWAGNFATSWVPNIVRSTARESDPTVREQRVWGKGDGWREKFIDRLEYKSLPTAGNAPEPKVDLWGRDIRKDTDLTKEESAALEKSRGSAPASDLMWRLLNPARSQKVDHNPLDRMLLNWNNQHPNESFAPMAPLPYFQVTVGGKRQMIPMTDKEYSNFLRLAGRMSAAQLQTAGLNYDRPTPENIKTLKEAISDARREARGIVWRNRGTADTR